MLIPVAGLEGGAECGPEGDPPASGDPPTRGDPPPSEGVRAINADVTCSSLGIAPGKAAAEETLRVGEGGVEDKVGWDILIEEVFNT